MWSLAALFLVGVVFAGGCSPAQVNAGDATEEPGEQNGPAVSSPEIARDTVLTYLREEDNAIPPPEVSWQGRNISPDDAVATDNFLYSYQGWTVSVVSPQIAPERKIFTVIVVNEEVEFKWAGLVDAYGKIVQMGRLQTTPVAPSPTVTPTIISFTPTIISFPTAIPSFFTPTPVQAPCNDASFLEDVTIPDGTTFPPGKPFLKEWRMRNVGSCTWSTGYDLIFVGGNRMEAQRAIPLAETVRPGEEVDLGAYMYAPLAPGVYRGFWMLRNTNGERFGVGDDADDSFWVEIEVVGDVGKYKYDFAVEYCSAIWRSEVNRVSCGDESSPQDGLVQFLISPELENRHENEATLWLHPNESRDGWIEGIYPAVNLESGDHFRAWVGCLAGYEL